MEQIDEMMSFPAIPDVQIHEIKPASKTTSFAALLEKFFLNMEDDRKAAQAKLDSVAVPAQSLVVGYDDK